MEESKKKIHGMRKDILLTSAALVVMGLVFVIFPEASAVTICDIIAAALCVWGAIRIFSYFRLSRLNIFGSYGLVQGAALILVGIFIFIKPEFLASFLVSIIGIVMIADGFLKVQYSVDLLRIKSPKWLILLILSLLMIVAGIIVLVNPFGTAKVLMIFAGITLIVEGITDALCVFFISRKIRSLRKAMEQAEADEADETYVDAEIIK